MYIQLQRSVSCGKLTYIILTSQYLESADKDCLADGFLITGEKSEGATVDFGDDYPLVPSLWHCRELCRQYDDCSWISLKKSVIDQGNVYT